MIKHNLKNLLLTVIFGISISSLAQDVPKNKKEEKAYIFKNIIEVKATSVKDQSRSGTCWSFACISFVESEIIRKGKGEFDLSEMFTVRNAFSKKAINYVRLHGKTNFSPGGQAHDVINVISEDGIVPEQFYNGKNIGEENHNHNEMDAVLMAMLKAVIGKPGGKLTPKWFEAYNSVLDVYLRQIPEQFTYQNKTYTPISFAKELEINPDDYIELTSYSHHPFYKKIILEIPDNWALEEYYNLPIDELTEIMDHTLKNGYTICWDGDVSDKGFSFNNGVAIIPEKNLVNMTDTDREKWEGLSKKEKEKQLYNFEKPRKEKNITQEMRQENFNNYTATDDHLMHIVGISEDQNGAKYYITKNSWGENSNDFNGYLNMSESYIRLNTIAIMVNKNALPRKIAKKLEIK